VSAVLGSTLDMALQYARAGYRVFPLHRSINGKCSCGRDCQTPGKHPRTEHGAADASTDETAIRAWWQRWPEANIGMTLDGHVVVDVDPRNGGDCDEWTAKLPETCCARTGGGGLHFLYRTVNGTRYNGKAGPGVDLKHGAHQYIVVEPSVHPSGERYGWLDDSEPWTAKPAAAPAWLAEAEKKRDPADSAHLGSFQVDANTLRDLRSALTAIRSDDRDVWVRVGLALKTIGDQGRALWIEWSQTSKKYDAADAARVWESFRPANTGHRLVFDLAQAAGWVNPAKGKTKAGNSAKAEPSAHTPVAPVAAGTTVEDFYAYLPDHRYIFRPARELWITEGVNGSLPPVLVAGASVKPSKWLDQNRAVEQITWAPSEPELIENKLIREGGFIQRQGVHAYNMYLAPTIVPGNSRAASLWINHLDRLYPDDADHLVLWFAHRVQRPGEKINHAIVLGGAQGIGKDSLLEPVKHAVGPWNWSEITPATLMGRFNAWARSVVARVSEVRDLGDVDRYQFYEHVKTYAAAPPDVLRIDEKNLREHTIPNIVGLVMTTNHAVTGMYLPPDDRRHFVAVSTVDRSEFDQDYFNRIHKWFAAGGMGHVAAYLRSIDLQGFDPKAPPRQTNAHRTITLANCAPEEGEMADLIEALGKPDVVTVAQLRDSAENRRMFDLVSMFDDAKHRRAIPHRMASAGYEVCPNPGRTDGLWKIGGRRIVVYARRDLPIRTRVEQARGLS